MINIVSIIVWGVIGAWEAYVYSKNKGEEDLIISVGTFGIAMFLLAMVIHQNT